MVDSARQIGRHFAVVSGVPALVVVTYAFVLFAAGAPRIRPSVIAAADSLGDIGLGDFGFLFIAVVTTGLLLQPLVFAVTQVLEGYWGTTAAAQRGMVRSARRHLVIALDLEQNRDNARSLVEDADAKLERLMARPLKLDRAGRWTEKAERKWAAKRRGLLEDAMPHRMRWQESWRLRDKYPVDLTDIMPTYLGNVLRRYERLAGAGFGLDPVVLTPLLAQTVDEPLREYHDDARTDLDLAVQAVPMWIAMTVVGLVLLWQHGIWLLLPAATSSLAVVAYRGAVHAAEAYGEALVVLLALGRFQLYEQLGLPHPTSSASELEANRKMMSQLEGEVVGLKYRRL